jgi:hypothetical protein
VTLKRFSKCVVAIRLTRSVSEGFPRSRFGLVLTNSGFPRSRFGLVLTNSGFPRSRFGLVLANKNGTSHSAKCHLNRGRLTSLACRTYCCDVCEFVFESGCSSRINCQTSASLGLGPK